MIPTSALSQPDTSAMLNVRIRAIRDATRDIREFELEAADGGPLPEFAAGAHIAVATPAGVMRQYSLCNPPDQTDHYRIAVKREAQGRGGSASMVDHLAIGDTLNIGAPVNQFELDPRAKSFLLIAGGIGITPLLCMAHALIAEGSRRFKLVYLTRDRATTAFLDELASPELQPHVTLHHDQGDPSREFDLWPLLEKPGSLTGQHVYCCGPRGLMDAVRDMTGHWPASAVHFESFGADTAPHADDQPFTVACVKSGVQFEVPVGRSILDIARSHGLSVPSSCESGTCGSCKTALIAGEADHRDLVLMPEEHASKIMVCVSRARSPLLEIDL